jgi:hypothetical protein
MQKPIYVTQPHLPPLEEFPVQAKVQLQQGLALAYQDFLHKNNR